MKLIHLLKRITAIITLHTLQTKLRVEPVAHVKTSLSLYSCDVLCVNCCTAYTTQHVATTFSSTKMHGLDSES